MRKAKQRLLISSILTLVMTSILSVGAAFAWFPYLFDIAGVNHEVGDLDNDANYSYWNKSSLETNKWQSIDPQTPTTLSLGEMIRIDQLPVGTESYFRFNFFEAADVAYEYQVILQTLSIITDTNEGIVSLVGIDYYLAEPSQKVYEYQYLLSSDPALDPTLLFANYQLLTSYQVIEPDQSLSTEFIAEGMYLYVRLDLRLIEIQNVINRIPVSYSPYSLEFEFNFLIEKRTVDEN